MTVVNHANTAIVAVSAQEATGVARLTRVISLLSEQVDSMPIEQAVSLKAEAATIQTATRELGMSKEAQELATEAVRRCEWAVARLIRKGQEEGVISTGQGGDRANVLGTVAHAPTDFASDVELYDRPSQGKAGILSIADGAPTQEEFDAALAAAKEDGNLSRANLARKIKGEVKPKPTATPTRADRAAHVRDLADRGYSSRQIAEEMGLHFDTIRSIVKDFDIDVPADAAIGRTRRLDHTQMVDSTVTDLMNSVEFIENHIDLNQVDFAEADEWVSSLTTSIRAINRFVKQIKEKTHV